MPWRPPRLAHISGSHTGDPYDCMADNDEGGMMMLKPELLLGVVYAAMERLVSAELAEKLPEHHLSPTQYRALRYLRHAAGSELVGLSLAMEISAPAATKLADRLEKGGWVMRQADQVDKRRIALLLTGKAEQVLSVLDRRIGQILLEVYQRMSRQEQAHLESGGMAFLRESLQLLPAEKLCLFCGEMHDAACPLGLGSTKRPPDESQAVEE